MLFFRKIVLLLGVSLTILVNISGAMRPMYKGVQKQVGTDLVQVYAFTDGSNEIPIPVKKWSSPNPNDVNGTFVETGEKVQVYLRNDYKDDDIIFWPRRTLWILGVTIVLYLGIGVGVRLRIPGRVPGT
jgi:hypothetical protein